MKILEIPISPIAFSLGFTLNAAVPMRTFPDLRTESCAFIPNTVIAAKARKKIFFFMIKDFRCYNIRFWSYSSWPVVLECCYSAINVPVNTAPSGVVAVIVYSPYRAPVSTKYPSSGDRVASMSRSCPCTLTLYSVYV